MNNLPGRKFRLEIHGRLRRQIIHLQRRIREGFRVPDASDSFQPVSLYRLIPNPAYGIQHRFEQFLEGEEFIPWQV